MMPRNRKVGRRMRALEEIGTEVNYVQICICKMTFRKTLGCLYAKGWDEHMFKELIFSGYGGLLTVMPKQT